MPLAIGIDLGTTNSCAYIHHSYNLDLIPLTKHKLRTIPSCVYYDQNEIIVGVEAEKRSALVPPHGIFDSKRMIGRKIDDPFIVKYKKKWPFTLKPGPNNECHIEIANFKTKPPITISPESVSAEILKQIKKDAETYTKKPINKAVITVPAYFNDAQRRATETAAKLANLQVLELINEPTAAALAYAYQHERLDRTILVYDLGGGTFDVSLVQFTNGKGNVIAKNGDLNLGGRDFDNKLTKFMLEKISRQHHIDLNDRRILRRLKWLSKDIKEKLSQSTCEEIEIDELLHTEHIVNITITRQDFENINLELFKKTIEIVDLTLTQAHLKQNKINDIVLIGGSSRIPKIRELLSIYFKGKKLSHGINPDEAVALGAALRASVLNETYDGEIAISAVHDTVPYSLGIEVFSGEMNVVIPKGSVFPIKIKQSDYITSMDNQDAVQISIWEGEDKVARNNTKVGRFVIDGITPLPKGQVKVEIEFQIDANGILRVTATESSHHMSKAIKCTGHYF